MLLSLLTKKVKCKKTLAVIGSALEAGYWDQIGGKPMANELAQGSMLSPLFCNMYLHEFDLRIKLYMENFHKGLKPKANPVYQKRYDVLSLVLRNKARTIVGSMPKIGAVHIDFQRLYYVRYADDFLMVIRGHKKHALDVVQFVNCWLTVNLKLELHPDKTFMLLLCGRLLPGSKSVPFRKIILL